ncbi:hypothetical protein GcM1_132002, partial [Golovinomyces cichoracearum]
VDCCCGPEKCSSILSSPQPEHEVGPIVLKTKEPGRGLNAEALVFQLIKKAPIFRGIETYLIALSSVGSSKFGSVETKN